MTEVLTTKYDERCKLSYWYPRVQQLETVKTLTTNWIAIDSGDTDIFKTSVEKPLLSNPEQVQRELQNVPLNEICTMVQDMPTETVQFRTLYPYPNGPSIVETTAEKDHIITALCTFIDTAILTDSYTAEIAIQEHPQFVDVPTAYTPYSLTDFVPQCSIIIESGEVNGGFPEYIPHEPIDSTTNAHISKLYTSVQNNVFEMSQTIANAFPTSSWKLTFSHTEHGPILTDMSLYGLYWNSDTET